MASSAAMTKFGSWGEALRKFRIEKGVSHKEVADQAGVSKADVKAWEKGEAYPAEAVTFKRLYGMLPWLKHYVGLVPKKTQEVEAEVILGPVNDPPPALEFPAPKTFGEALRRARIEEGSSIADVSEVVGILPSILEALEAGKAPPKLEKSKWSALLDLFPGVGVFRISHDLVLVDGPSAEELGIEHARACVEYGRLRQRREQLARELKTICAEIEAAERTMNRAGQRLYDATGVGFQILDAAASDAVIRKSGLK